MPPSHTAHEVFLVMLIPFGATLPITKKGS
jgi:hypothetical protein